MDGAIGNDRGFVISPLGNMSIGIGRAVAEYYPMEKLFGLEA